MDAESLQAPGGRWGESVEERDGGVREGLCVRWVCICQTQTSGITRRSVCQTSLLPSVCLVLDKTTSSSVWVRTCTGRGWGGVDSTRSMIGSTEWR